MMLETSSPTHWVSSSRWDRISTVWIDITLVICFDLHVFILEVDEDKADLPGVMLPKNSSFSFVSDSTALMRCAWIVLSIVRRV